MTRVTRITERMLVHPAREGLGYREQKRGRRDGEKTAAPPIASKELGSALSRLRKLKTRQQGICMAGLLLWTR